MNNIWRCPICKRLLSYFREGIFEIETKNRQIIKFESIRYEAVCKCGIQIKVNGRNKFLVFHKKA